MASTHVALVTAGGTSNRRIASSLYGYCTTAASTAAKTVSLYTGNDNSTTDGTWAAGDLVHGLTITVRFQYSNSAANPTLNVNGTGAKAIYKWGNTVPGITAETSWQAQSVITLTYDTLITSSGCWVMNDHLDDTTGGGGTGVQNMWYGTSSTANSTQAKVATTTSGDFTLSTGNMVRVKFDAANSYNGVATLNVDGTGAVDIARIGSTTTTRYYWVAGEVVDFVYDGTNFVMSNKGTAGTTYYGLTKLSSSTSSTSTSLAATASAVKAAYDLADSKVSDVQVNGTSVVSSLIAYIKDSDFISSATLTKWDTVLGDTASFDLILDYLADHIGVETTAVNGSNSITGALYLVKDKWANTVRGYGYFRRSSDIASSTNIFVVPSGYRPSAETRIAMQLTSGTSNNADAYYGVVRTDGGIRQAIGNTVRSGYTAFEYSL